MGEFRLKDPVIELYRENMRKMVDYRNALLRIFDLVNGADSNNNLNDKVFKIAKEALYG